MPATPAPTGRKRGRPCKPYPPYTYKAHIVQHIARDLATVRTLLESEIKKEPALRELIPDVEPVLRELNEALSSYLTVRSLQKEGPLLRRLKGGNKGKGRVAHIHISTLIYDVATILEQYGISAFSKLRQVRRYDHGPDDCLPLGVTRALLRIVEPHRVTASISYMHQARNAVLLQELNS